MDINVQYLSEKMEARLSYMALSQMTTVCPEY